MESSYDPSSLPAAIAAPGSPRLAALTARLLATLTAQVAALSLGLSLLTRLVLIAMSLKTAEAGVGTWLTALVVGGISDLATLSLALLPVAVFEGLLPARRPRTAAVLCGLAYAVIAFSLLFLMAAELIFWDEFGTRFNFIAVDYLVYTHEVVANIRQSYPVGLLVSGFALAAVALAWGHRAAWSRAAAVPRGVRALSLVGLALMAAVAWQAWSVERPALTANRYANEIAGNGLYALFSAYRHNELDYTRHYPTLPAPRVQQILKALQVAPAYSGAAPAQPALTPQRRHVVLITVESLSADYLGAFGNREGLTPHLDRLAQEGLLFTHLYATGTRTVRGLESLSLSVPPTPGQSIVRRPHNEDLATLGAALNRQGYHAHFLYGGYGYFDNMNYYFSHNGYEVQDRSDIPDREVGFSNAWGIADEYLFRQALKTLDREAAQGPQFLMLMTTSNHRPYTYPDGRIDIPSPGGRAGAVKYTDHAIGRFLDEARRRPWFRDTLFVIVADHCAASAGKTALPVYRYHIPAIVYAPGFIAPGRETRMVSQIDLAPTLLGLLGLPPEPHFFGKDVLHDASYAPRALIANYQELGLLKGDRLVVLAPRRGAREFRVTDADTPRERQTEVPPEPALVEEAIAYYQGAAQAFRSGRMRLAPRDIARRAPPRQ